MGRTDLRSLMRKPHESNEKTDHIHPRGQAGAPLAQAYLNGVGVLRVPGGYSCSHCGSVHTALSDAHLCLSTCTLRRRLSRPFALHNSPSGQTFQCAVCAKSYLNSSDAVRCADVCIEEKELPSALRSALERAQIEAAERTSRDRRSPLPRAKDLKAAQPLLPLLIPRALPVLHPRLVVAERPQTLPTTPVPGNFGNLQKAISPAESLPTVTGKSEHSSEEEVTEPPDEVLYRTRGQKPFTRHDAKYVCTVCATRFFTKNEVESCFESHPLLDAEITV